MSHGGKRDGSGRKKIGAKQIKIILDESTLEKLNEKFHGTTQADKVRQCINKGLDCKKSE